METAQTESFEEEIPLHVDRWKMFAGLAAIVLVMICLFGVTYFVGTRRDTKLGLDGDNPSNPSIPLFHTEGAPAVGDGLPVVQAQPGERRRPRATAPAKSGSETAPATAGGTITL